ncbi:MAG: O-antigen ligase family protein [Candidatus Aminicenantes bacterium]
MQRLFPGSAKISFNPHQLLPLFIAFYLVVSMVSISLSQIFLFLAFLSWLFLLIREKQKPSFPSFFWPLLAYSLLSLISSFRSVNPQVSLKDSRELLLYLVVPMVYTAFRSEKTLRQANLALLGSAFLSLIYSFYYFFFQAYPGERITGFMGHYMTQAGLLLLFSAMALSMSFFSKHKTRFLWGLGFLLSLVALTLTLTRSCWIGVVVAACVILFLYKPRTLIIVPVAVGLFFLASPEYIKERALSSVSLNTESNKHRIEYIRAGVRIIRNYPLLGTGPDTVDMEFQNPKYKLSEKARMNVHLHNNIIQIAAERGIPTAAAWLTFMLWTFFSLTRLWRKKDPRLYPFTAAALAALGGLAAAGLFEYNFADSEIATLFLYMMSAPFALDRIRKKKANPHKEPES